MDVLIIGGGASGIMAALTAAQNKSNNVTLIERQSRIGRKLLSTGNGRCNITNTGAFSGHYYGNNPSFASFALEAFSPSDSLAFFKELGLITSEQYGGRVYPFSDSANSVVDVLRFALDSCGVHVITSTSVSNVSLSGHRFYIRTDSENFSSDKVIIACGGLAGAKLGGVRDGYDILKSFGHKCTKLYPALVPIYTDGEYTKSLKGVRCQAKIQLSDCTSKGELQFIEKGISGPAAFDLSRKAAVEKGTLDIDLLPDIEDIYPMLQKRAHELPSLDCGNLLTGILHNRLGMVIVKYSGIKPSANIGELTENQLKNISTNCKHFRLNITGVGSFDNAQVSHGGIDTCDFNDKSMESLIVPGLYACGEVLDIDGDCGGYNLRWAWSSGHLAGLLL